MNLPIRTLCGKRTRIDNTVPIYIQYCYSSTRRILLNTELAIPPKYWSKKQRCVSNELPTQFGDASALNLELRRMVRTTEDIVLFGKKEGVGDLITFVKETFSPSFEPAALPNLMHKHEESAVERLNFFSQFEDYIRSKQRKVSPGMLKVFSNVKNVLREFEKFRKKEIKFEEIDFNFYEELVDYLLFEHKQMRRKEVIEGLRMSTAGKVIKQLRIFLRNRMRKKIIAPIDLDDFKILDEECDAIYLSEAEITKLLEADLSDHPHLDKYRFLLIFGCMTGLRFSDFSTVKMSDIRGRRLYKKQGKSDHWVVIPLRDEAYHILVNVFKGNPPRITNADFNYYIKEVGREAGINEQITFSYKKGNQDIVQTKPKCQWITSHTCRRSFCTNEFLAGMPAELIMKISGHKSLRDFYKYIRISPEEAAKQVEKIWKERHLASSMTIENVNA